MILTPPKTEKQKQSQKAYIESISRVEITMKKDKKKRLQDHADSMGESVNQFVNRAIDETMERDIIKGPEA